MYNHGPQLPAFSLAGGIATASFTAIPWWTGIIVASAGCLLYAALLRSSSDPVKAFRLNKWHKAWILLVFAGIGIIDEGLHRPTEIVLPTADTSNTQYLKCEVKDLLTRSAGDRLEVEILGTNGAKARILSGATDVSPGDIVAIPASYLHSVDADTTAFGRRLAPLLKARGILYSGRVPSIRIEKTGRSASPRYFFTDIRNRIEINLENSHLEPATVRFINAILMGDRTGLDEQTRLTFARGGTAHALALSGMHLAIIAGLLMMLIWPAKLAGKYKWGYGVAIVLLWLYVLMTGMANSSVRAAIMITLTFLAVILERKNCSKNALWAACLIILTFDPSALFDAGFQLSVTCVAALLYFAPALNPIRHREHPVLFRICEALLATMIATAASWALTSYYFGQIPMMFLTTNLLLLPLLPIFLAASLIFTIFICAGIELTLLGRALDAFFNFLLNSVETLACGGDYVIEWQIPLWGVMVWTAILITGAWLLNRTTT